MIELKQGLITSSVKEAVVYQELNNCPLITIV